MVVIKYDPPWNIVNFALVTKVFDKIIPYRQTDEASVARIQEPEDLSYQTGHIMNPCFPQTILTRPSPSMRIGWWWGKHLTYHYFRMNQVRRVKLDIYKGLYSHYSGETSSGHSTQEKCAICRWDVSHDGKERRLPRARMNEREGKENEMPSRPVSRLGLQVFPLSLGGRSMSSNRRIIRHTTCCRLRRAGRGRR